MSFRSKPSRLACLGGVEGDRPMSIRVGIGGWTYEPWRGTFYPPGHPQKRELDYAGRQLTGNEINGTYYGSQKPETFANWADRCPTASGSESRRRALRPPGRVRPRQPPPPR